MNEPAPTMNVIIKKGSAYKIRPWARRFQNGGGFPATAQTIDLVRCVGDGIIHLKSWERTTLEDVHVFADEVMDLVTRYTAECGKLCRFELTAANEDGLAVTDPYSIHIEPVRTSAAADVMTFNTGLPPMDEEAMKASTLVILQQHLMETQRMLLSERKVMQDQAAAAYRDALAFKDAQLQAAQAQAAELRERVEKAQARELEVLDERRELANQRIQFDSQLAEARGERLTRLEDKAIGAGVELAKSVLSQVVEHIDPGQLAELINAFATAHGGGETN